MKEGVRIILSVIYAAAFAVIAGNWAIYYAYMERGYKAPGGEYFVFWWVFWIVYKAMRLGFRIMED